MRVIVLPLVKKSLLYLGFQFKTLQQNNQQENFAIFSSFFFRYGEQQMLIFPDLFYLW
jgi:hypothetical protein